jgi:hypothetical protein
VDNSSNSRADAAYDKALAAYQEKSYEVARRWVVEALAHNRHHSGARTLLGRLDAARTAASPFHTAAPGSEVVSTDPTILISRASGQAPMPDSIEPTVMVRRDDPRYRSSDTDPRITFPPLPPPRTNSHPVSEPTIIGQPKPRTGSSRPPKSSFSLGAALQSLGARLQGRGSRPGQSSTPRARSTGSSMATPTARGALLAVATVLVGALLVWGLFATVRWVWPPGQVLTITKPTGGTITGPGIECGTRGTRCSTTITTGEPIELATDPDKGFVWTGFTGDCAPAGRTSMSEPRTCGATFGPVVGSEPTLVTFRLTITKPVGGTIVGAGGILCGTNGATCSTDLPSGVPVDLIGNADDGYQFEQFTGDCPSSGKTMMTSAKTCGGTFIPSSAPINRGTGPVGPPVASGPRPRPVPPTPSPGPVAPAGPANPQGQPAAGGGQTNPSGSPTPIPPAPTPTPPGPEGTAKGPVSAEEHAKQEIGQLVKNYCTALETLKPATVRGLFHLDNERELKARFKEYKSLKCTVAPPEYDRIDAGPAGAAQLKFGMKQAIQMASGGAPKTQETIVTMVVSRKDFQSPWLIDRVTHEEKPK